MTFKQHLQNAMNGKENQDENRRHPAREVGDVLLSLERERALRNLIREVCGDGADWDVE